MDEEEGVDDAAELWGQFLERTEMYGEFWGIHLVGWLAFYGSLLVCWIEWKLVEDVRVMLVQELSLISATLRSIMRM